MLLFRFAAAMILALCSASQGFAGGWPPAATDISVTLSNANGGCLEGNDCRLAIQVENLGSAPFKGGLSVIIETAAPSVPGFAGSGERACERLAYGRMACRASSIELAPSETLTGLVSVRFLPTIMSEVEACATIDWRGSTGTATKDALRSVSAALGKSAPAVTDAAQLLSAVFGTWGNGDLRQGNDRGCVTIAIGDAPAVAACPEGQERIAGNCTGLDDFCSGSRQRNATTGNCACPTKGQDFDTVSRICETAAAPNCDGGRTAKDGLCFCPEGRPLWNAEQSRCEEWRERTAEPVVAEVEEPAAPAPRPRVIAPVKRVEAPARRRVVVRPSCGRSEILRGTTCVRVVTKTARKPKPTRLAQRNPVREAPARRYKVNRCPLIFAICIIKVLRERRLEREARGL